MKLYGMHRSDWRAYCMHDTHFACRPHREHHRKQWRHRARQQGRAEATEAA